MYLVARPIRISSVIIAGNKISLNSKAETLDEIVAELAAYDDPNYGTQNVDLSKHQIQMSHLSLPQGTLLTRENTLPEKGTLALNITSKDNKNGK